jgi:hypothetical protein
MRENNMKNIRVLIKEEKGEENILGEKTKIFSESLLITMSREDLDP